ncbi:hypothetical protein PSFL_24790 [Pseudomonas sp. DD1]
MGIFRESRGRRASYRYESLLFEVALEQFVGVRRAFAAFAGNRVITVFGANARGFGAAEFVAIIIGFDLLDLFPRGATSYEFIAIGNGFGQLEVRGLAGK